MQKVTETEAKSQPRLGFPDLDPDRGTNFEALAGGVPESRKPYAEDTPEGRGDRIRRWRRRPATGRWRAATAARGATRRTGWRRHSEPGTKTAVAGVGEARRSGRERAWRRRRRGGHGRCGRRWRRNEPGGPAAGSGGPHGGRWPACYVSLAHWLGVAAQRVRQETDMSGARRCGFLGLG